MSQFEIVSDFRLTGDQPQAVDKLVEGLNKGFKHQTLLGVTGSGKTFTMANVIERVRKPTLVISHNKTLAAQLCSEFKEFFPNSAAEYFVSYYDYYQPEAYIPRTDTYIEKETDINEEIDKLRHSATRALFERRDVLIVASVSCIYGLGEPEEYHSFVCSLKRGNSYRRDKVIRQLVDMQYERNDIDFTRGRFRIRGDTLEIQPAYEEIALRVEFFGDDIERIVEIDPLTGELLAELESVDIYPAKHFVTSHDKLMLAIEDIKKELEERLSELRQQGKLLEAARLEARTNYDIEMLKEAGYCTGVENYSRHLSRQLRIQHMKVGEKFVTPPRIVTRTDIETFCTATGQIHPLFSSDAFIKSSEAHQALGFKGSIAPGHFALSIFLGNLVGAGLLNDVIAQLATNNVKYTAPVYPYDMLRTEIEITGNRVAKSGKQVIVDYKWAAINQDNVTVIQGDNTCMFKNV